MKNSVILSGLALAASVVAQESLISIPIGLCAGILGDATCDQTTSAAGGLIDVPLNACIAALGDVKCNQVSSASSNQSSLISVPINICIAVLGEVTCNQKASAGDGLIDIPINLCLAVLGDADCKQNNGGAGTGKKVSVVGTATVPTTGIPTVTGSGVVTSIPTVPVTVPTRAAFTFTSYSTISGPAPSGGSATGPAIVVPHTIASSVVPEAAATSPVAVAPVAGASSTVYVVGTSTTTYCPGNTAPSTLIPAPSAPAVAPTGVVPRPSTSTTGVTPAFTGAAGRLEMSGMAVALGAMAIVGFQL